MKPHPDRHPMTRRAALTTVSTGVAGLLAACGTAAPSAETGAKAGPPQAIEWWTGWGGQPANDAFDKIAEVASAQSKTYQVTHVKTSGVAKKLAEAIVAGSPPDVETGNLPYAEFWVQGYAEPLDQRISKSKVIKKDELPAAAWKFAGYKGKTYGVPAVEGFIRWGLAANEDLLAKRGLDPTKLPTTWDDLLNWHQQLTVESGGTIQQLGLDPLDAMGGGTGGPDPLLWGPSWGIHFYDEEKTKFDLTNPALEEAVGVIKKFYDLAGGGPAVAEFRKQYGTWTGAKSGITVGTQAMQINGPWTPGELAKGAPEKKYAYTWIAVPNKRKGKKIQSTGGHFANLPKGSPHPDQGFEFIEVLWSDQALNIIFEGTGWLTALKPYLAKVDTSKYRGLDFYIKSVAQADEMWEAPVNPIDGFFGDKWSAAMSDVINGKVGAKAALDELQRVCTEELTTRLGRK